MTNTVINSNPQQENKIYNLSPAYVQKARFGTVNSSSRVWEKPQIVELLENNDKFVVNSLLRLYDRQTTDEKAGKQTKEVNKIGFNSYDAPVLSGIAAQVIKSLFISSKQIQFCRRKLMKYAGQLTQIANGKL